MKRRTVTPCNSKQKEKLHKLAMQLVVPIKCILPPFDFAQDRPFDSAQDRLTEEELKRGYFFFARHCSSLITIRPTPTINLLCRTNLAEDIITKLIR
ncbi:MAG TPA: hypothetical protein VNN20_08320 [Thermodesulfobacteriota bacterium]|nr:hypothetical protein [Thermodesulfobacteriota bacterium]